MPELIITLSDGRTLEYPLASLPVTVGRDAACDIAIDDPSASRRHARFVPTIHGYVVEDLGSKNGTLVNNLPCGDTLLRDRDEVLIGTARAIFRDAATTGSPATVVVSESPQPTSHTRYVSREQALALSQKRLQLIYDLTDRLTTLQSHDQLVESAMSTCFETLGFERGAIGIRQEQGTAVEWPVVRNLRGSEGELCISHTLLTRALEHGERAIFDDDASRADPTVSMMQHGIRSAMCVPLLHKQEILGVIYGDQTKAARSYTTEDIDFFAAIARQVAIGLVNARLAKAQERMARLNHDIDLARKIQRGLFPADLPDTPELRVAALNEPGARVSGDYYDVIPAANGATWLLVADVTGEGLAASLMTANLQAAVRATIASGYDPSTLLTKWNTLICENTTTDKFITCVLAMVDPKARVIRYATAGHPPPLIVRSGSSAPEVLPTVPAFPLGIFNDAEYTTNEIALGADPCAYVAYSDGIIEAISADGNLFGTDRLLSTLTGPATLAPPVLLRRTRKAVADFVAGAKQSDDITLLVAALAASS